MAITNLEQKQNRKLYVPIRPGNRGGWSLFNWESVRQMPYKDREMYLGNSATIGVLDKCGKWRKKDWYLKTDKLYQSSERKKQELQTMRKDRERLNNALGTQEKQFEEKLTQQQMKELMKRIKKKKSDVDDDSKDTIGLGFDKLKVQIRAKPAIQKYNPYKLEGIQCQESDQQKERIIKENKHKKHKKDKSNRNQKKQRSRKKIKYDYNQ